MMVMNMKTILEN